jgi:hypothetical protein
MRFIIDYVSLQLVFNNWYPFSTQVAPAPYAKMTPPDVMSAIKRNQMIFVPLIQPQSAFFFQVSTSDVYMIPLM